MRPRTFESRAARRAAAALIPVLAGLVAGCGTDETAKARQVLADLEAQNYRSFARPPGWETRRPSTGHHGIFVDIYINDVMLAKVKSDWPRGRAPEGAIIVKDGWSGQNGDILHQIAVMKKEQGGAEWFYAEYTGAGEVLEAGYDYDECLGCHGVAHDYVLSF